MGFDEEIKMVEMYPSTHGRLAKIARMLKVSEADVIKLAAEVMEDVVDIIYDGGTAVTITNRDEVKTITIPGLNDDRRK
jgi:hypothetical protein